MPSSSARCAQFPRAQDKVHYYIKLKDLRDQLKGIERSTDVQEVQYTFDLQLAQGLLPSLPHQLPLVAGFSVCSRVHIPRFSQYSESKEHLSV